MEDALRHAPKIFLFVLICLNSSCAWYKNVERSLVEDEGKNSKSNKTVPRDQYDRLLIKYEELAKKYEELKENPNAGKPSLMDELKKNQVENYAVPHETETIDLFADNKKLIENTDDQLSTDLSSQIDLFTKAKGLIATEPGEATKIFQQLDSKAAAPVKVRAKYQLGELLLTQGQYDLSLQIFEDIINHHAYSGVVLQALRGASICADKLGSQNKKDQYESMLSDVFESK